MRRARPFLCLLWLAASPAAAFTDDFESHGLGDLDGQGGWVKSSAHTGGSLDVENTTVLAGLQSVSVTAGAGETCEYEQIFSAESGGYTASWSWGSPGGLAVGGAGFLLMNGNDWTEAIGVWIDDWGDVYIDDATSGAWGWGYVTSLSLAPHSFQLVVDAAGAFDLYIDTVWAYSNTALETTVDRVLLNCASTGGGADLIAWDDVGFTPAGGPPPPAISIVKTQTGGTRVGEAVQYQIVVTNTGTVNVEDVIVVDTISPVVVSAVTTPAGGFTETATDVPGTGTRYEWSATGIGLAPAGTLTFTIDGAIGLVCASTPVWNEAYASATAPSGWTEAVSTAVGGTIDPPPPAALSVVQTQTPPFPAVAGPVQYQIVVTNTGGATLDSLVVVDTISPAVTLATQSVVVGFAVSAVVQGASGTVYSWESTAPFYPNATATFTIDGTVGSVCVSTNVSNTGFAAGSWGCGTAEQASSPDGFDIVGPAFTISTVNTQSGGSAVGEAVQYQIVVTNTGAVAIDGVDLVDTLPGEIVNASTIDPAGFGPPTVTPVAGGNRYEWAATGLGLAPAGTLTFTVNAQVGLVCASTGISNTAYAVAAASCAQTSAFGSAAGSQVDPPAPAALSVVQTQTPPSPVVTGPVQYQIVVTNTGGATLDSLMVVDTISPVVTGVTQSTPVGFPVSAVVQGASGTIYSWSSAGPFYPGDTATFTIDGTVGSVCVNTNVSNTGYAAGSWACGTTEAASAPDGFDIAGAAFSISTVNTQTGGNGAWDPVHYQIVVTNTGSLVIDDLTVVDTISPVVGDVTTTEPGGWLAPTVTSVVGGTRYEWSGTGLGFAPAATLTFTIDGAIGLVCASTGVSNTAYASGSMSCAQTSAFGSAAGSLAAPPATTLTIVQTLTPPAPASGAAVQYQFVVTNTGATTLDSLVVVDTVQAHFTAGVQSVVAGFAASAVTETASGTVYSWSSTGPFLPGATATFLLDGIVGLVCFATPVSNKGYAEGASVCGAVSLASNSKSFSDPGACGSAAVEAAIAITPAAPALCEAFAVDVTITNTGSNAIDGLNLDTWMPRVEGPGVYVSGPVPPMPDTLAAGATTTYRFVYRSTATGNVTLSTTPTGTDSITSLPVGPWLAVSPTLAIPAMSGFPANIIVSTFTADQPRYVAGTTMAYTIVLWNGGGDPAENVRAWDSLPPGLGYVGCGGAPCGLIGGTMVRWDVGAVPSGGTPTLTLQVTAPGDGTCPPLVPAPGSVGDFIAAEWTDACGNPTPWPALAPSYGQVSPPPEIINAQVAPTVTPSIDRIAEGGAVTYSVRLANACSDTAFNVRVWDTVPAGTTYSSISPGGTHAAGLVSWPPFTLGPGLSTTVFFTVSVTSPGPWVWPAAASASFGNSAGKAQPLGVSPGITVTVMNPSLTLVKTGPAAGSTDDFLPFSIFIRNAGTDTAYSVVVTDSLPPQLSFFAGSGTPTVAGKVVGWAMPDLPPGAQATVTVTAHGPGTEEELTLVNLAGAACRNSKGIAVAPGTGTATVVLTPKLKLRVFPTPFSPGSAVRGTLKFSGLPESARVRIFTVSGTLVKALETVSHHRIEWDGRTGDGGEAAPGLYLYVIELPGGKQVKGNFGLVR